MLNFFKSIKKSDCGFSLVEVVVGVGLLSMIAIAAMSLIKDNTDYIESDLNKRLREQIFGTFARKWKKIVSETSLTIDYSYKLITPFGEGRNCDCDELPQDGACSFRLVSPLEPETIDATQSNNMIDILPIDENEDNPVSLFSNHDSNDNTRTMSLGSHNSVEYIDLGRFSPPSSPQGTDYVGIRIGQPNNNSLILLSSVINKHNKRPFIFVDSYWSYIDDNSGDDRVKSDAVSDNIIMTLNVHPENDGIANSLNQLTNRDNYFFLAFVLSNFGPKARLFRLYNFDDSSSIAQCYNNNAWGICTPIIYSNRERRCDLSGVSPEGLCSDENDTYSVQRQQNVIFSLGVLTLTPVTKTNISLFSSDNFQSQGLPGRQSDGLQGQPSVNFLQRVVNIIRESKHQELKNLEGQPSPRTHIPVLAGTVVKFIKIFETVHHIRGTQENGRGRGKRRIFKCDINPTETEYNGCLPGTRRLLAILPIFSQKDLNDGNQNIRFHITRPLNGKYLTPLFHAPKKNCSDKRGGED